ncbi:MAG: helix-turn-helix transcriptional regulator [Erysipelotrichaceae bacterium]|nr:helix-turn-helix transcriptional regulator [Erysipelotrichaceae bacterium]
MDNHVRGIIELKDYGKVEIKLRSIMDRKRISIYQMSKLTSLKHSTIKSYYNNCPITRVDLDVLSKLCYVLDCKIEDILEYKYPD